MRDIRASVEVRAFIGADKLCELHGDAFVRYECWQCGRPGRTTEPTSVIVFGYRVFRVVGLAHAACADSQIIEVDAARIGQRSARPLHRSTASKPEEQAYSFTEARTTRQGSARHEDNAACAQARPGP
jgi:hypothetical protein